MSTRQSPFLHHFDLVLDRAHLVKFSVWGRVKAPTLLFTAWATIVYLLHSVNLMPGTSNASSLVGILSMVTGLMVSFRSGSSYDRWYEGRRTWASMQSTSRTLLRTLSLSAPAATHPAQARALRELASLVVAFGYATMHRLRDQPGVGHPELAALLPPSILSAYAAAPAPTPTTLPGGVEHSNASEPERATAALNLPDEVEKAQWSPRTGEVPSNLPLFLLRAAQASLVATKVGEVQLDPAVYGATTGALQAFTEQLTSLERIRDTPIPLVLQLHLQLLLLFFVGSVPLQLVGSLGAFSIPATAIACIVYYGIDKSAEEMSDPFGTEANDLPVARFCQDVEREARELGLVLLSGSDKKDL